MAAPKITTNELNMLVQAVEQAITSAQRQQNMKNVLPDVQAAYKKREADLTALKVKITQGDLFN